MPVVLTIPNTAGFSRNPASTCVNWVAYPDRHDVGSITDAVVNGDGGFHAIADMTGLIVDKKSWTLAL
jgi:hypothetical protein